MQQDIRDRWGRKIGTLGPPRRSCLTPLLLIPLALLIVAVLLCIAVSNYVNYHQFTLSSSDALKAATATITAPYHQVVSATSAERSGNTSLSNDSNTNFSGEQAIEVDKGGSLTFNFNVNEAGTYYVCIDSDSAGGGFGIVDASILVNGNLLVQFSQNDIANGNGFGGSSSPDSCVTSYPAAQLQAGANTIELQVTGAKCFDNGNCDAIDVYDMSIDKNFS